NPLPLLYSICLLSSLFNGRSPPELYTLSLHDALPIYLMASSKKGISAHQLHRTLGVTYKTAWFMAHRLREAMRSGELAPMGGAEDRKSTRLNSSHVKISYAVFCLKKKNKTMTAHMQGD